jgi:hypothetical protein
VVAQGLYEGIRRWLQERPMAARYDALVPGGEAGSVPGPIPGEGPPFAAAEIAEADLVGGSLPLRLTNTGTRTWSGDLALLLGWEATGSPYLAQAPATLEEAGLEIPALAPGESATLHVPLELPEAGRSLLWLSLADGDRTFADLGSPALQLAHAAG